MNMLVSTSCSFSTSYEDNSLSLLVVLLLLTLLLMLIVSLSLVLLLLLLLMSISLSGKLRVDALRMHLKLVDDVIRFDISLCIDCKHFSPEGAFALLLIHIVCILIG
jgi:hypothetical protein